MNPRYILVMFSGIAVCTQEYYIHILGAQPENTISVPPMKKTRTPNRKPGETQYRNC